ncbi:MAG: hypothetical protein V9E85_13005 [Candidatus Nanopelagicales bacterium]
MDTEQYRRARDELARKAAIVADNMNNVDHNGRPTKPREPVDEPTDPR